MTLLTKTRLLEAFIVCLSFYLGCILGYWLGREKKFMRYETVTKQMGEYLGPIDWNYDFSQHNWDANKGGINPELSRKLDWLRELEADPAAYVATTDGGWPKVGWKRVIAVGMYDGWPFWKPVPSVQIAGTLGAEWHPWYSISAIEHTGATK